MSTVRRDGLHRGACDRLRMRAILWLVAPEERVTLQPFNFAIEAMSTFKFLELRPRSILRATQLQESQRKQAPMAEAAKSRSDAPAALPTWPDEIYRVLKDAGIRQVAMVPDAGHSRLIRAFETDPETRVVTLTTEEEGVAMLAGAWLGGERGVLLLQSSGVGNCINMLSLPVICHMPLLMIVTMRGDWGEFNPWQIPMGQGTRPSLEAMGVLVNKVDEPHLVASTVQGAANLAFNTWKPVAVLIGQRVLGAKNFKELARK
jgi:sulfopyruvate decarboxylase alpha subunit